MIVCWGCLSAPLSAQWRQAVITGAHVSLQVDMWTTAYYLERVPTAVEQNPILGARPSVLGLGLYTLGWHLIVAKAPKRVRPWVAAAVLAVELWTIRDNPCPLHSCSH